MKRGEKSGTDCWKMVNNGLEFLGCLFRDDRAKVLLDCLPFASNSLKGLLTVVGPGYENVKNPGVDKKGKPSKDLL